jgi:diguanylate cyclase (GGDEF)-like protein
MVGCDAKNIGYLFGEAIGRHFRSRGRCPLRASVAAWSLRDIEGVMLEQNVFLLLPVGVVVADDAGRLLEANPAALRLLELTLPRAAGHSLIDVLPSLFDRDGRFEAGASAPRRVAIKYQHGRRLAIDLEVRADADSRYYLFLSRRERSSADTLQAKLPQQFEIFLDNTPDFIYFKMVENARHRYVAVSQSLAALCGFSNWRDMIGLDDFEAFPTEFAHAYYRTEQDILASGKELSFRETYLAPDGTVHWVNSLKTPIFAKRGKGLTYMFGISRNIDELVVAEGKVLDESRRDPLTGALNRRILLEDLSLQIGLFDRYRHRFAMLLMDVDAFKAVNDTHGHAVGDEVLKAIVALLLAQCRETDRLYRIGGDEFVLLMPETGAAEAAGLAERMQVCVREHRFEIVGVTTLSIGVSEYAAGETEAELMARCDAAMYTSKRAGRDSTSLAAPPVDDGAGEQH